MINIRKCTGREIYRPTRQRRRYNYSYYLIFDTGDKIKVFKDVYDNTTVGDWFYMVNITHWRRIFPYNEDVLDERLQDMFMNDMLE